MPRYARKKYARKRKTFRKAGYKRKSAFKKRVRAITRGAIRSFAETKYFERANIDTTVTNAGQIYDMFAPDQGTGVTNRIAQVVQPSMIRGRIIFTLQSTTVENYVRIMVFRWHQDSGTDAPQVAELLTDTDSNISTLSFCNWDKRQRYTVLFDKTVQLETKDTLEKQVKFNLSSKKRWTATDTGTPSTHKGGIYMLVISNSLTSPPYIRGVFRITFKDV